MLIGRGLFINALDVKAGEQPDTNDEHCEAAWKVKFTDDAPHRAMVTNKRVM